MTLLHANTAVEQPLADYDMLAEYMAGRLSDVQTKRFEKRLIDDPQFFRRMAPLLSVLYPVEPPPIELEVRSRVVAHRAAKRRAKEAREARRRRVKGWIAAVATAALPVKVITAGLATGTLVYAVMRLERPSAVEPPRIFVQVPPTAPDTPSTQRGTPKFRTQPRPTVVATNPPVVAAIPELPLTLDSAALERALAENLATSPELAPRFTPAAAKVPAQRARNLRAVAVIQIDTLGVSRMKQIKDFFTVGVQRVVGAVAGTIGLGGKKPDRKL